MHKILNKKGENYVFIISNRSFALTNSRVPLIKELICQGYKIVILTKISGNIEILNSNNIKIFNIEFERRFFSPLKDFKAFLKILFLYILYKPDLVHSFNAKPVIFSSLVKFIFIFSNSIFINTITGLGHAFIKGNKYIKKIILYCYKFSNFISNHFIFQNHDDLQLLFEEKAINKKKSSVILGSGIDLKKFKQKKVYQNKKINILMIGRVLWQKGAFEYCLIAEKISKKFSNCQFSWAGEIDSFHPDSVNQNWIESNKYISFLGIVKDIPKLLENTDILVFPSYREGLPRAIMEASASGIPSIGFDVPGVREVIINKHTGFLVPFRDLDKLESCTERLISDIQLRKLYGLNAYNFAHENFDINFVVRSYMELYFKLGLPLNFDNIN